MRHIIIIINLWSIYFFFIQDQCCQCLMNLKYQPDFPFNSLPSEVAAWCYLWSSCGTTLLPHPRCQCTGALTLSGYRTGAPWAFCSQETGLLCCHSEWSSRKCCQWSEWRTWTVLPSFLTQPQASVQINKAHVLTLDLCTMATGLHVYEHNSSPEHWRDHSGHLIHMGLPDPIHHSH